MISEGCIINGTVVNSILSGGVINGIKGSLDYEGVGGAMFLGLSKTVVKGHGNSKANGFAVCIKLVAESVRGDMVGKIQSMLEKIKEQERIALEAAASTVSDGAQE